MIEDKSLHDKAQIIVERKDIVYSLDCNVERFDIGL